MTDRPQWVEKGGRERPSSVPVSPLFVMLSQLDCFQETCEGDFQGIPWSWMPRVPA